MSSKKTKMFISKEEFLLNDNKNNSKSPLTKKSLIKRIAVKYNLPEEIVESVLKDFFLIISKHSKQYSYVSLYGLGKFKEKKIKSKYVKLPGNKRKIKTKEKKYLVFKSSFEL